MNNDEIIRLKGNIHYALWTLPSPPDIDELCAAIHTHPSTSIMLLANNLNRSGQITISADGRYSLKIKREVCESLMADVICALTKDMQRSFFSFENQFKCNGEDLDVAFSILEHEGKIWEYKTGNYALVSVTKDRLVPEIFARVNDIEMSLGEIKKLKAVLENVQGMKIS